MMMLEEVKAHLLNDIIPFWKNLRDDEFGGYYGYMDYDLKVDKRAVKGCILNSRITWFFANAYTLLKDESLLEEAKHGFAFMKEHCMDKENGGIFWSMKYDGTPEDTTKHTYNQALFMHFPLIMRQPMMRKLLPWQRSCSISLRRSALMRSVIRKLLTRNSMKWKMTSFLKTVLSLRRP